MPGDRSPDAGHGRSRRRGRRDRRLHQGWPGSTEGLRELVGLVLAAVRPVVHTSPATAGADARAIASADRPVAASGLPGASQAAGRSRPAPNGRAEDGAVGAVGAVGSDSTADSTAAPDIDEAHAATWQLVAKAQQGDGDAFGQLYDQYVDAVYRFIYYRVHDRGLAEDFTSETFLRALRRISTIGYQGRDIGAWFTTIARNIVLDHVKSARNRLEVTTGEVVDGDRSAPSTEQTVLASLTADRLIAAVKQLGDDQRECVELRFIQGLSVAETADVMGRNDGAIKALQHRAVRKLAQLVGPELR